VIGFGDREGDGGEVGLGEMLHGVVEEKAAQAVAAAVGCDAELGNVGDVVGYAGAEDHAGQGVGGFVSQDPGLVGVEYTAAGEADDVVKETQGAVQGTVLIVDARVDVVEIGLVDQLCGGLVVVRGPGEQLDVRREIGCGTVTVGGEGEAWGLRWRYGACGRGKVVLHEEAGMHSEASGEEGLVDRAGVEEEELRFDAMDAGRVLKELEEMMEKGAGDVEHLRGVGGYGEGVSDYGFVSLVDAEGEAADASAVEGYEAWEDARVEILQEEFGGTLIVPAETLLPGPRLGFEKRAKLTRGEVPQVEDFELGRDGHFLTYIPGSPRVVDQFENYWNSLRG
jgi:hypothetical protein